MYKLDDGDAYVMAALAGAAGGLEAALAKVNEEFFLLTLGGRTPICRIRREFGSEHLEYFDRQSFLMLYGNQHFKVGQRMRSLGEIWLDWAGRHQYREGPDFQTDPALVGEGKFNMWRGFGVEPEPGDCATVHEHMLDVVCSSNPVEYDYLLRLLAWWFQNPLEPGRVAVVLRGGQGVGKSLFGHFVANLAGTHGRYIANAMHLIGKHNNHMLGATVCFADEAFFAGDRASARALKTIITEPRMTIEPKGVNAFSTPNMTKLIMATNERWAIYTDLDDRRFFVPTVSATRRGDKAYFNLLYRDLKDDEVRGAFLHELLAMDLRGFDPTKNRPSTAALLAQKRQSLEGVEAFLADLFETGVLPGLTLHRPNVPGGLVTVWNAATPQYQDWEAGPVVATRAEVRTAYFTWFEKPANRNRNGGRPVPAEVFWPRVRETLGKCFTDQPPRQGTRRCGFTKLDECRVRL